MMTHAIPLHADPMLNVPMVFVPACQSTKAMLILDVDQNVLSITIALATKHAFETNAKILVQELAVKVPFVK